MSEVKPNGYPVVIRVSKDDSLGDPYILELESEYIYPRAKPASFRTSEELMEHVHNSLVDLPSIDGILASLRASLASGEPSSVRVRINSKQQDRLYSDLTVLQRPSVKAE